jgi:hypothetical protein
MTTTILPNPGPAADLVITRGPVDGAHAHRPDRDKFPTGQTYLGEPVMALGYVAACTRERGTAWSWAFLHAQGATLCPTCFPEA